jgi:hypothetical protein
MCNNEKGGPADRRPIPKIIPRQEHPEFTTAQRDLQVARLIRHFAMNASMAEALAPMIFGVLS